MVSKGFKWALGGLSILSAAYLAIAEGIPAYVQHKGSHVVSDSAPVSVRKDGVFTIVENNNIFQALHDEGAVLYFTTKSCVPCRLYKPQLAEALRRHPQVQGYEVEVDNRLTKLRNIGVQNRYGVRAYPTTIFLKKGKEAVDRIVGNSPEYLEDRLLKLEK